MSNKANNLAIVAQIKTLLEGLKLEGDTGHDAFAFFYNDRVDHEDKPDEMTIQGCVEGCPCTIAHSLVDMEKNHLSMRQAMEAREQLNNPMFAFLNALGSIARKANYTRQEVKKEEPKPAADETAKATTEGTN